MQRVVAYVSALAAVGLCVEGVQPAPRLRVVNFETDVGAVPEDSSLDAAWKNGRLMNATLANLSGTAHSGSVLLIPAGKQFYLMGGIRAAGLVNFTLDIQGKITMSDDIKQWPRVSDKKVLASFHFDNCTTLTIAGGFTETKTRSQQATWLDASYTPPAYDWEGKNGVLDGQGHEWWGIPLIGYAERQENRPRLLEIDHATDVLVTGVYFRNSGYWTFLVSHTSRVEVADSLITAMRSDREWMKRHTGIDLTAFNTDGFDFSDSDDIYVHNSDIWNQDDSVCLKDNTKNVLVERVSASGLGLTIGSIGNSYSLNVTFRDCIMRDTDKGVYMKFRGGGDNALIQDITYENIIISGVNGWPIWIGPAQQSDSVEICAPHPCSLCWPQDPFAKCSETYSGQYSRIALRNITITDSKTASPGVIIGDHTKRITNLTMENVQMKKKATQANGAANLGAWWDEDQYFCENTNLDLKGANSPVPKCT